MPALPTDEDELQREGSPRYCPHVSFATILLLGVFSAFTSSLYIAHIYQKLIGG